MTRKKTTTAGATDDAGAPPQPAAKRRSRAKAHADGQGDDAPKPPSKRRGKRRRRKGYPGPGRPTKYSPEVAARIVGAVRLGATYVTAATAAGISRDTLHAWLRAGANAPAPKRPADLAELATVRQFSDAMHRAASSMEVRWLGYVHKGAEQDARHAQWLLTHHPATRERYADPAQRVVHEGGVTNTNLNVDAGSIDLSALSDEELEALDRLAQKAVGRTQPAPAPSARRPAAARTTTRGKRAAGDAGGDDR